jgi:hypothetical protein
VASAIGHWKPRFTANGVAPPDFERITSDLERWEQWCEAWSHAGGVHEVLGREALKAGHHRSAVLDEVGDNADFLLLDDGNHGCANVAYKHRYRTADWMAEQLWA